MAGGVSMGVSGGAGEQFGDYQTPAALARRICRRLKAWGIRPRAVVEPTCGTGTLLREAAQSFPDVSMALGLELNPCHVRRAKQAVESVSGADVRVRRGDFFQTDWSILLAGFPEPLLVLGNPPWVSNSRQGRLDTANLPPKQNATGLRGIDALTGKSNFDISESMLTRLADALNGRRATLAMLCKTSTARKTLGHAWRRSMQLAHADMVRIDAQKSFGVSVDACLLVIQFRTGAEHGDCRVFPGFEASGPIRTLGFRRGRLIADLDAYRRRAHLLAERPVAWRSGIKHDCVKVMELREDQGRYRNGWGDLVDLEPDYLYPLLKSSRLARCQAVPDRWMLVTQQAIGQDTATIRRRARKTWRYLLGHADSLDRRRSSIYRNRPRFAIFGVGPYSFCPWKIAISGFYKQLEFQTVGSYRGKPVVLDDTCYFLPCSSKREADTRSRQFNSSASRDFLSAFIFWDAKRPITREVLALLDFEKLAGGPEGER